MKLVLMWVLSVAWFLILAYLAIDAFTAEAPILSTNRLRALQGLLAGVGALTVGLLPIALSATIHVVRRRRLRHRLEKQKARIEKQLARLDQRQPLRPPRAEASSSPS